MKRKGYDRKGIDRLLKDIINKDFAYLLIH